MKTKTINISLQYMLGDKQLKIYRSFQVSPSRRGYSLDSGIRFSVVSLDEENVAVKFHNSISIAPSWHVCTLNNGEYQLAVTMATPVVDKYRPSNNSEADAFFHRCHSCLNNVSGVDLCSIRDRSFLYSEYDEEYPSELRYVGGEPTCVTYTRRN